MLVITHKLILFLMLTGVVLASRDRDYYGRYNQDWSASQGTKTSTPSAEQRLRRILLSNFMKLVIQKSLLAAIESEKLEESTVNREDQDQEATEEMVNKLSVAIRNVGVGYNIIYGSPDGNFNTGGIDPGILSTRVVFDFTYERGKEVFKGQSMQVPDQVNFQPQAGCSSSSQNSVYSGAKSYQKSFKFGASPGGMTR